MSDPISELYGNSLGFTEQTVCEDILDVCRDLGRIFNVKFHPKDNNIMRNKYRRYEIVGHMEKVVPGFKVVISMSTMGLLHSYLLGVPIVSYQPGLIGKDMCITNLLGITNRIDSKEELKKCLTGVYVNTNSRKNRLIWEDGKSTKRVCASICKIAQF